MSFTSSVPLSFLPPFLPACLPAFPPFFFFSDLPSCPPPPPSFQGVCSRRFRCVSKARVCLSCTGLGGAQGAQGEAKFAELLAHVDADGSGEIDCDEFEDWYDPSAAHWHR